MTRTHRQVIALWDSLNAFAADVDASIVSVRKWRQRGHIPADHWPVILKTPKAKAKKVTLDELHSGSEKGMAT